MGNLDVNCWEMISGSRFIVWVPIPREALASQLPNRGNSLINRHSCATCVPGWRVQRIVG
jgi:hypothetical protein